MEIMVRPVTRAVFQDVIGLKVTPEQEGFVAPNLYSLAEAHVEPTWTPLAIFAGEDLVGFAMFGQEEATGRWWIMRFMIDAMHQGKGYGAAALRKVIARIVERHGASEMFLSYVPGNESAERLYARAGFVLTGEMDGGEVVARLDVG